MAIKKPYTKKSESSSKAFENKEGRGALFEKEKENEKQPDYSGSIKIDGRDYWLSGWLEKGKKSGVEYISLAATIKDDE